MKAYRFIIFLLPLLFVDCSSVRSSFFQEGNSIQEMATMNAITDFSKKSSIFRKESVFSVSFIDTIYTLRFEEVSELERISTGTRDTHRWVRDSLYQDLVAVIVFAKPYYQYYYKKGEKTGHLPSRYLITSGKLFYWRNLNYPVTNNMIDILSRYDLLQDSSIFPGYPEGMDLKKIKYRRSTAYFFCRNDLSKFKKDFRRTAIGYYKPPKLICDCKK